MPSSAPVLINIPAGRADTTLLEFGTQTQLQVLFDYDGVGRLSTKAVKGKLPPLVALDAMLEGTGLVCLVVDQFTVTIKLPAAPQPGAATGTGKPNWLTRNSAASRPQDRRSAGIPIDQVTVTSRTPIFESSVASHFFTLPRAEIESMGFVTVPDVVHTLPQVFGGGPTEDTSVDSEARTNSSRGSGINFRGLGAGSTLVLLNGHRLAGSGTEGLFVDVSNVPLAAVERLDILPESSSTHFGADAVGGVLNFVMRDRFAGRETEAHLGGSTRSSRRENYVSQIFGLDTDTGHGLLAFDYYDRDSLPAADRSYLRSNLSAFGGSNFDWQFSNPGNIMVGGQLYAIPKGQDGTHLDSSQLILGTPNLQNRYLGADFLPTQRRFSGFFTWRNELTDHVAFFTDVLTSRRKVSAPSSGIAASFIVPNTNPWFLDPTGGSNRVLMTYSFLDDLGPLQLDADVRMANLIAGLDIETSVLWHFTLSGVYAAENSTITQNNGVDFGALQLALADPNPATAFNPFGDGTHTNPATLNSLRTRNTSETNSLLRGVDADAFGPLFHVPTGSITLSTGMAYREQSLVTNSRATSRSPLVTDGLRRSVSAAFGELRIPLWDEERTRRGLQQLELSIGGRYEDYSDFGNTTAARYGILWSPTRGLAVRGTWSESFRPPSLADLDDRHNSATQLAVPDPSLSNRQTNVLIWGPKNANLRQETAHSWTLGLDFKPLRAPHFTAALTYFSIDFKNRTWAPTFAPNLLSDPRYGPLVTRNPTREQIDDVCRHVPNSLFAANCYTADVSAIVDLRVRNAASVNTSGIDLMSKYERETRAGTFLLAFNGTYTFNFVEKTAEGFASVDRVSTQNYPIDFRMRSSVGWRYRGWNTRAFVNFANHYRDVVSAPNREVASFTTLDVNLNYDLGPHSGFWPGRTTLGLSIENVMDRDPPFLNNAAATLGYDPENADPTGRMVRFLLRHTW